MPEVYAEAPTEAEASEAPAEHLPAGDAAGGAARPLAPRIMRPRPPAARAERPAPSYGAAAPATAPSDAEHEPAHTHEPVHEPEAPAVEESYVPTQQEAAPEAAIEPDLTETPLPQQPAAAAPAPGRQVRTLRLTADALKAGVQPGQRVNVPVAPAAPAPAARDRGGRATRDARGGRGGRGHEADASLHGTPGETATPQTTYIPPADARRPGGRSGRGGRPAPADAPCRAATAPAAAASSATLPPRRRRSGSKTASRSL